jgi:hypothetical protein
VAFASASVPRIWHRHTHGCDARVPAPASSTQEVRKSIRQMACISVRRKECHAEFPLEMRLRPLGNEVASSKCDQGGILDHHARRPPRELSERRDYSAGRSRFPWALLPAPARLPCPDVADCECAQGTCTEVTPICPGTCSAGDPACPGEDGVCLGIGKVQQPTRGLCIDDREPANNAGECCSGDFCPHNGLCGLCPPAPGPEPSPPRLHRRKKMCPRGYNGLARVPVTARVAALAAGGARRAAAVCRRGPTATAMRSAAPAHACGSTTTIASVRGTGLNTAPAPVSRAPSQDRFQQET